MEESNTLGEKEMLFRVALLVLSGVCLNESRSRVDVATEDGINRNTIGWEFRSCL